MRAATKALLDLPAPADAVAAAERTLAELRERVAAYLENEAAATRAFEDASLAVERSGDSASAARREDAFGKVAYWASEAEKLRAAIAGQERELQARQNRAAVVTRQQREREANVAADAVCAQLAHGLAELSRAPMIVAEAMAKLRALAAAYPDAPGLAQLPPVIGERIAHAYAEAWPKPLPYVQFRPAHPVGDVAARLRRDIDAELRKAGVIGRAADADTTEPPPVAA